MKFIPQTDPFRIPNHVALSKFTEIKVTLKVNSAALEKSPSNCKVSSDGFNLDWRILFGEGQFQRGLVSYRPWNQMLRPLTQNLEDLEVLFCVAFILKYPLCWKDSKNIHKSLGWRNDKFGDIQYHIVPSLCRSAADQMEDQPVCCQPLLSCLWGYKSIVVP